MNDIMNQLAQLRPEDLKALLMHLQQGQPQPQGMGPMGDPNMQTDVQQQFDPQMLANLLRGQSNQQPGQNSLASLFKGNQPPTPTGTQTIGIRG